MCFPFFPLLFLVVFSLLFHVFHIFLCAALMVCPCAHFPVCSVMQSALVNEVAVWPEAWLFCSHSWKPTLLYAMTKHLLLVLNLGPLFSTNPILLFTALSSIAAAYSCAILVATFAGCSSHSICHCPAHPITAEEDAAIASIWYPSWCSATDPPSSLSWSEYNVVNFAFGWVRAICLFFTPLFPLVTTLMYWYCPLDTNFYLVCVISQQIKTFFFYSTPFYFIFFYLSIKQNEPCSWQLHLLFGSICTHQNVSTSLCWLWASWVVFSLTTKACD